MLNEKDKKKEIILQANEETSFKLYLYIKNENNLDFYLDETPTKSPFYYKKSFTINDFYSLHNIFRSCLTLDEILKNLFSVIQSNKMSIKLKNDDEQLEIKMNVINFCTPYEIKFDINRSFKDEKENLLTEIYEKNKKMLNKLKLIRNLVNRSNNLNLINYLNILFNNYQVPGIEKPPQNLKVDIKKFCTNWIDKFILRNQKKNVIRLNLRNLTKIVWNKNNVNLVCDKKRSTIICENVAVPKMYDIEEGQDGDFFVFFPFSEKKNYICILNLMIEGKIYYEYEIILNITVL